MIHVDHQRARPIRAHLRQPDGKDHKITIPDYKEGITDAEIKTGAQAIVDQGAFEPDGFALAKVVGAVKVDTTRTEVAIEETV